MDDVKISVIDDIEHIQKYPGMYIGSTNNPDHLLQEILDNSIDELLNGYATNIHIIIENNKCQIEDDGRGIPIHQILINDKLEDSIVVACTKLHSGAKFENSAYNFSIGMHGIGLVAVNSLSKHMIVSVTKETQIYSYYFTDGKFINQTIEPNLENKKGTIVYFEVNKKFFNSNVFDISKIKSKLILTKHKIPNCNLYLNDEEIQYLNKDEYYKYILDLQNVEDLCKCEFNSNNISLELAFKYNNSTYICGDVNLHKCDGYYINNIITKILEIVKLKINTENITTSDITNNLRLYVSCYIKNPRFDSQTKQFMEISISKYLNEDFKKILNENINETFLNIIKQKYLKKIQKKISSTGKRVDNKNPLVDARKIPAENLYIVEGESAGGTVRDIINNDIEGVFPVTGKIMNVNNNSIDDIINSKKMSFLLEALGVDLTSKEENFRYKNIKILGDADSDGGHICVLIILTLFKFAPRLISEGRVSLILPPLYGGYDNKKFIPIYSKNTNIKITKRFKGLGEMNPNELEVIIRNKYEYQLQMPSKLIIDKIIKILMNLY